MRKAGFRLFKVSVGEGDGTGPCSGALTLEGVGPGAGERKNCFRSHPGRRMAIPIKIRTRLEKTMTPISVAWGRRRRSGFAGHRRRRPRLTHAGATRKEGDDDNSHY
jgi:hypothetical protein